MDNYRCYFRCTHKHDQDCRAAKQVQIIQENPIIYHTTYFGQHACNSLKITKHEMMIISQSNHNPMVEMESPPFEIKPKLPNSDAIHDSTVKEEDQEIKVQSDVSSTMDSNLWQDFAHDSIMADHSSYFERVISSDMEDFDKFSDFHFDEAIEFS